MATKSYKTIIILSFLLLVAAGFIGTEKYNEYDNNRLAGAYQQGAIDAQLAINANIINALNTQGYVDFTAPAENNQTVSIKLGIVE